MKFKVYYIDLINGERLWFHTKQNIEYWLEDWKNKDYIPLPFTDIEFDRKNIRIPMLWLNKSHIFQIYLSRIQEYKEENLKGDPFNFPDINDDMFLKNDYMKDWAVILKNINHPDFCFSTRVKSHQK